MRWSVNIDMMSWEPASLLSFANQQECKLLPDHLLGHWICMEMCGKHIKRMAYDLIVKTHLWHISPYKYGRACAALEHRMVQSLLDPTSFLRTNATMSSWNACYVHKLSMRLRTKHATQGHNESWSKTTSRHQWNLLIYSSWPTGQPQITRPREPFVVVTSSDHLFDCTIK